MIRFLLTLTLFLLLPLIPATRAAEPANAATVRPINSAFTLEAGSSHLLDTYLSPLHHTGWHTGLRYERTQAMKFSPQRWQQQLRIGAIFDHADNPAKNASLMYANFNAAWGMSHRWTLPCRLRISAGGIAQLNFGGMYTSRNGNNPASVKADITLGVTATAGWSFKAWRMPVDLRWQTTMPLLGALFSPEYDELYYEIYLGNRHGLAHFAWPGNLFRWDNRLTADLDFAATRLRLGMGIDIFSSKVNHITTRNFSYSFILGVVADWVTLSRRVNHSNTDFVY